MKYSASASHRAGACGLRWHTAWCPTALYDRTAAQSRRAAADSGEETSKSLHSLVSHTLSQNHAFDQGKKPATLGVPTSSLSGKSVVRPIPARWEISDMRQPRLRPNAAGDRSSWGLLKPRNSPSHRERIWSDQVDKQHNGNLLLFRLICCKAAWSLI